MVHFAAVLVLAVLVGTASAYPQSLQSVRKGALSRRQAVAEAGDDNSVAVEAPTTLRPGAAQDAVDEVDEEDNALGLPSNATSIRAKIVDSFSCEGRVYGYYADVDNDCQVFHVCLPVKQPGSRGRTFKWSFICPAETLFNQEKLTCTRPEDAPPCTEAPEYFRVNDNFGVVGKPAGGQVEVEGRADAVASRSAVDGDVETVTDVAVEEDAVEATTQESS